MFGMKSAIKSPNRRKQDFKLFVDRVLNPLCRGLTSIGIQPNVITLAGVFVTFVVPVEILHEKWTAAGLWLLVAGFFDILDGALARNSRLQSPFGAFWDSTLDRVSEAFVFGGLLLYYGQHQKPWVLLLAFSVCILSFLVPYVRARAEGLGIDCKAGILQRPGRVVLLALGFLAFQPIGALILVGVLSLATLFQRVFIVWKNTSKKVKFR
jgi:CDP-diacylglycerol--glycerol-3-phosphate 3-phosphatidyltransferase